MILISCSFFKGFSTTIVNLLFFPGLAVFLLSTGTSNNSPLISSSENKKISINSKSCTKKIGKISQTKANTKKMISVLVGALVPSEISFPISFVIPEVIEMTPSLMILVIVQYRLTEVILLVRFFQVSERVGTLLNLIMTAILATKPFPATTTLEIITSLVIVLSESLSPA